MRTVTLEEAQAKLAELVGRLPVEHEIAITQGNQTVAKITDAKQPDLAGLSVFDIMPVSVGRLLKPYPDREDDILSEMLESE
jgi:antitoxin (DNA-binding transcriptional repressor) of toxin-antitoxin stability system